MKCTNCGSELPNDAKFCDTCGCKVENNGSVSKKICPKCGGEIESDSIFCGNCGADLYGTNINKTNTNKKSSKLLPIIIIILSIMVVLTAGFGVYYFYNEYIMSDSSEQSELTSKDEDDEDDNRINRKARDDDEDDEDKEDNRKKRKTRDNEEDNEYDDDYADHYIAAAPIFTYASASSVRGTDSEGGQYSMDAVLSTDRMTKWVPSKSSDGGLYEWIQINAPSEQHVSGVYILNGYHKDASTWQNNNRVKSCTLSFSDGQSKTVILDDTMDMIEIDFDTPVDTEYIRLTINSIYKGNKWDDTAITYIGAY